MRVRKMIAVLGEAFVVLLFVDNLPTDQSIGQPVPLFTELQKHERELAAAPTDWMPWNYLATLESGQGRPAG